MDWQPIGTAPKDGARILVCCEDDEYPEIVFWTEWKPGWSNGDWTYDPDDFTLWMPAPKPPLTKENQSGTKSVTS